MSSKLSKKKRAEDANLPVIECSCGAKILLVPNVKTMSAAIEAHAVEHARKFKAQKEKNAEAEKVRVDLIAKVLAKAFEA